MTRAIPFAFALASLGCASSLPLAPAPPAGLSLRTTDVAITAMSSGDGTAGSLSGPYVQLTWDAHSVRGTSFGNPVSLDLKADRITGLIGELPVQLKVSREGDGVEARGLYGGQLSRLRISPSELEGTIGACSYSLDANGGVYEGHRRCRRGTEPVSFSVGSEFGKLPPGLLVASVGTVLGQP